MASGYRTLKCTVSGLFNYLFDVRGVRAIIIKNGELGNGPAERQHCMLRPINLIWVMPA